MSAPQSGLWTGTFTFTDSGNVIDIQLNPLDVDIGGTLTGHFQVTPNTNWSGPLEGHLSQSYYSPPVGTFHLQIFVSNGNYAVCDGNFTPTTMSGTVTIFKYGQRQDGTLLLNFIQTVQDVRAFSAHLWGD